MSPIEQIFGCFDRHGGNDYGGERVRQLEHALQCAALAEAEGAEATLITAALLHDIGHLIHDLGGRPARAGSMIATSCAAANGWRAGLAKR